MQIARHADCKHLTSFSSHLEQIKFLVLAFGLSVVPLIFTKLNVQLPHILDDVILYLDEMLFFHQNLSDHLIGVFRLFDINLTVRTDNQTDQNICHQ